MIKSILAKFSDDWNITCNNIILKCKNDQVSVAKINGLKTYGNGICEVTWFVFKIDFTNLKRIACTYHTQLTQVNIRDAFTVKKELKKLS